MGDMDWHNHMGIFTYPIKVAVEKNTNYDLGRAWKYRSWRNV